MRAPAVVGSWPEPFVHGFEGSDWSAGVYCGGAARRLRAGQPGARGEGVNTGAEPGPEDDDPGADGEIRVLVGPWEAISDDPAARLLRAAPSAAACSRPSPASSPRSGSPCLTRAAASRRC